MAKGKGIGATLAAVAAFLPRRPAPPVERLELDEAARTSVFMLVSLGLRYPGTTVMDGAVDDAVGAGSERAAGGGEAAATEFWQSARAALAELPPEVAANLQRFFDWQRETPLTRRQEIYVATFDQKRRASLDLSYYAVGDTRQRGAALLAFRQVFLGAGFEPPAGELPDFLPGILELVAAAPEVEAILSVNRAGIELLHAALADLDSPYSPLVVALRQVLPPVDAATEARCLQLLQSGPPAELVGIRDLQEVPWAGLHYEGATPVGGGAQPGLAGGSGRPVDVELKMARPAAGRV